MATNHIVTVQITTVIERRYRVPAESVEEAERVMQEVVDGPVAAANGWHHIGSYEMDRNVEVWAIEEPKSE